MDIDMTDDDVRNKVVKLLELKGYSVRDMAMGSGVPRFSRVEILKGQTSLSCAVKTTKGGRISFTRNSDGTYKVLSAVDRVIIARRIFALAGGVRISMFDSHTVLAAFEANHKAKVDHAMEHIPSWVNAEHEEGWRLIGSGFQEKCLWSEIVSPASAGHALAHTPSAAHEATPGERDVGIMDRIKAQLSEHLGVRPEMIEVDVRVKL